MGSEGSIAPRDGGETWDLVLEFDEDTGVTDLEIDTSNPGWSSMRPLISVAVTPGVFSRVARAPASTKAPTVEKLGSVSTVGCRPGIWARSDWRSLPKSRQ